MTARPSARLARTVRFWLLLLLLLVLSVEGLSRLTLAALDRWRDIRPPDDFQLSDDQLRELDLTMKGKSGKRRWDPDLGWTMTPNYVEDGFVSNSAGLCSHREYDIEKPAGVIRIAAFGDSWVQAAEVSTEDSWPGILERRIRDSEVLNFGVAAYGPDQAWLRYQLEGTRYKPDIVLICHMTENINRIVNVFRPFYGGRDCLPFTKPRFLLKSGELRLLPNPIRRVGDLAHVRDPDYQLELGQNDFWYQYRFGATWVPHWVRRLGIGRLALLVDSQVRLQLYEGWAPLWPDMSYDRSMEEYKLLLAVLHGFYTEVATDGARPLVAILAPAFALHEWREHGRLVERVLLQDLDSLGIIHVDHCVALDTIGAHYTKEELFATHPSPLGNALEAEMIIRRLLQSGWLDSAQVIGDPLRERYAFRSPDSPAPNLDDDARETRIHHGTHERREPKARRLRTRSP